MMNLSTYSNVLFSGAVYKCTDYYYYYYYYESTNLSQHHTSKCATDTSSRDEIVLHNMACTGRFTTATAAHEHHRLVTSCREHVTVSRLSNGIDVWRHVLRTTSTEHLNHLQFGTVTYQYCNTHQQSRVTYADLQQQNYQIQHFITYIQWSHGDNALAVCALRVLLFCPVINLHLATMPSQSQKHRYGTTCRLQFATLRF